MAESVIVKYGELALKGLNKPFFERKLVDNIKRSLKAYSVKGCKSVKLFHGRIVISLDKDYEKEKLLEALKKVFGIAWFAFCFESKAELAGIRKEILDNLKIKPGTKISVSAKRANKELPFTSSDVNNEIGKLLVERFRAKVSLDAPELEVFIELASDKAFIFTEKLRGLGGLPSGVSGRVLHLLSGGIDSPVAAWLLMKRGCKPVYLHFHGSNKFDEKENEKIIDLVRKLNEYSGKSKILFVPFYRFELEALKAPEDYRLLLFRRFMMRVAEKLATEQGIPALSTGDNLAQVASQTLENLVAISRVVSIPVFRPLLTNDKQETIELSQRIGAFDISILPYRDCCTVFMSKHPKTKAQSSELDEIEKRMNMEKAVEETLKLVEIIEVK